MVVFRRVGGRVLLEQPNLRYRALSPDSDEVRAVRESFATSVLWAGEIAAEVARRPAAGGLDVVPGARRARRGRDAQGRGPGRASRSTRTRSVLDPDELPELPRQPRVRSAAHLRRRGARARGARHRADAAGGHAGRSTSRSCACPTRATAARVGSALGLVRGAVRRLRAADRAPTSTSAGWCATGWRSSTRRRRARA